MAIQNTGNWNGLFLNYSVQYEKIYSYDENEKLVRIFLFKMYEIYWFFVA